MTHLKNILQCNFFCSLVLFSNSCQNILLFVVKLASNISDEEILVIRCYRGEIIKINIPWCIGSLRDISNCVTIRNLFQIEMGSDYGNDFQNSLGVDPSNYRIKNLCSNNLLNIFSWGVLHHSFLRTERWNELDRQLW